MESFQIILNHREQNTYNFETSFRHFLKLLTFSVLSTPACPHPYLNKTEQFPKHFVMFLSFHKEQSEDSVPTCHSPGHPLQAFMPPTDVCWGGAGHFWGLPLALLTLTSYLFLSHLFTSFSRFGELASPPGNISPGMT